MRAHACVFLALTGLSAACVGAFAQTSVAALSPIVVTGTRTPTRIDQTIADTTVLDRETISRSEGRTLAELLAQLPGLQFASNGGLGKSSSVFIRGLEARHTLLLVDGVRYGSATVGSPSWENLPLEEIDRIEIVRGPLSSLYGSDAVGGVVQIFTRRGTQGLVPNARVAVGSEGYRKLSAGMRFGQGPLDGAIQLQRTRVRGFSSTNPKVQFGNYNPDNDGFEQDAASLRFGAALGGDWRADVRFLRSEGESQIDDGPGADARAGLVSEIMATELSGSLAANWRTLLRASRSKDAYNTLSSASPFSDLGTIATVQEQLTWENTFATPVGSVIALAEHLNQTTSRPGQPFSVPERSIRSVALGLNGSRGPHYWQASVRQDSNSQFGRQTNSSVGYGIDIIPSSLRATASYGTSFVAPSFNQLYFPGFGNANLQPEEGKHAEAGLRWVGERQEARATYFSNRIRGYISSGPAPANIPRTRIDGWTLAYEAKVAMLCLVASADHVDPRNITPGTSYDKQLPRRAKNSLKLAADAEFGAFSTGATFVAFDERFDNAANSLRLGGYGTVDLHADWRFQPDLSLGVRLNNVGDKRYETVYGYNQPGREVFVTLRYEAK